MTNARRLCICLSFLFALPGSLRAQRMQPPNLIFGSVPVVETSSQNVTMSNPSPWYMTITRIQVIDPADFSQTNNCNGHIVANGSCTMTVTFGPSTTGNLAGEIYVTSHVLNGVNTSGQVSLQGTGTPAVTGYINPKYAVVAVVYAPPGSKSNVDYTSSNLVSSTQTVTHTFMDSVTKSVSVTQPGGIFGFLGGSRNNTSSTKLTQQSQDSTSVTASYTDTSSLQLFGPGPSNPCGPEAGDFIGVDHNCDIIKVWLNPVMLFTLAGPGGSGVQWNGYGYSELDLIAPIDIVDVLVGCLNGHLAPTDSRCATAMGPNGEFQRPWAASENWPAGEGPALTATDISNILAADPWGQCPADAPIGSSACPTYQPGFVLLPPQFTISDLTQVPYHQGSPGTGWSVSATSSSTQSQESKTTHEQTWGYEDAFKGSGWLQGFEAKVSVMRTLTTAYEVENSTTVTNTKTGVANITGAACNGNPCNPVYPPSPQTYGEGTEFDIFVDNFFGTFAFVPSFYH